MNLSLLWIMAAALPLGVLVLWTWRRRKQRFHEDLVSLGFSPHDDKYGVIKAEIADLLNYEAPQPRDISMSACYRRVYGSAEWFCARIHQTRTNEHDGERSVDILGDIVLLMRPARTNALVSHPVRVFLGRLSGLAARVVALAVRSLDEHRLQGNADGIVAAFARGGGSLDTMLPATLRARLQQGADYGIARVTLLPDGRLLFVSAPQGFHIARAWPYLHQWS